MDRRKFLTLLGIAAPVALIVPELILPKRTFFLPPAGGWRQTYSHTGAYTKRAGGTVTYIMPDQAECGDLLIMTTTADEIPIGWTLASRAAGMNCLYKVLPGAEPRFWPTITWSDADSNAR